MEQAERMSDVANRSRALKNGLAPCLALCLALTACGRPSGSGDMTAMSQAVPCAIGAGSAWSRDCAVERDRDILTVRHADGGFRRFRIVRDGRGVVPADGAEQAGILVMGKGEIELSVGQDRYRLPARLAERKGR
ncbi:hypothetical protein [Sphingobium sp.]|uniref:hypothetical protein n=1 Tax=Sphingobium sp. TaxID=1912891 RepID=UPI0028BDB808|nr:hypothetical protein [Sphingobium sp.]